MSGEDVSTLLSAIILMSSSKESAPGSPRVPPSKGPRRTRRGVPMFTPEEMAKLENNPIYLEYTNANMNALTPASIYNDLAVIVPTLDNLPLIRYLNELVQAREGYYAFEKLNMLSYLARQAKGGNPTGYGGSEELSELTDFSVHRTTVTLADGACTNEAIYAPGAGFYATVLWLFMGSDLATSSSEKYFTTFDIETSGVVLGQSYQTQLSMGLRQQPIFYDVTVADKDILVTVTGGDGVENLHWMIAAGKHA